MLSLTFTITFFPPFHHQLIPPYSQKKTRSLLETPILTFNSVSFKKYYIYIEI